ncbi:MAG: hypothetical protein NMNS01_11540 [Nitrosomonas sp.]|nr:MAG: hypothetical protein NMNS01_11540 [Nitrosomonas sp.]
MTTDSSEEKKSLAEKLKHPTANMIIGFLLTSVLGTGITNYYSAKRQQEKQHEEMVAINKTTIAKLASLNAERLARAEQLVTTVERGELESVKELKKMYQETELRWKMESSPALMAARQVLPQEKYYRFRDYMENEYRSRFLTPISQCIEQASQAKEDNSSMAAALQSCRIKEYLHQAGNCNTAILDILFEMAKGTIDKYSADELEEQKATHKKRVAVACAPIEGS